MEVKLQNGLLLDCVITSVAPSKANMLHIQNQFFAAYTHTAARSARSSKPIRINFHRNWYLNVIFTLDNLSLI